MHDLTVEDMNRLLQKGEEIRRYAWDNYEALKVRPSSYVLYGPYEYGIGAGIPGSFVHKQSRALTQKTKRKNYSVYELDEEFRLLRVVSIRDYSVVECAYYCFERDGFLFACSFRGDQKQPFKHEIIMVGVSDGMPWFLGFIASESAIAEFYEYKSNDTVTVTQFVYSAVTKYTPHGYLVDWQAPTGALNAPVQKNCWEEPPMYTDFSQWFK